MRLQRDSVRYIDLVNEEKKGRYLLSILHPNDEWETREADVIIATFLWRENSLLNRKLEETINYRSLLRKLNKR
jgi:hypothetical protein